MQQVHLTAYLLAVPLLLNKQVIMNTNFLNLSVWLDEVIKTNYETATLITRIFTRLKFLEILKIVQQNVLTHLLMPYLQ